MPDENPIVQLSPWPAPVGGRRAYHAMIKPVGAICNMDCTYCYYLHKKELLGSDRNSASPTRSWKRTSGSISRDKIASEVVFSWQGGEPTLLGLEFFEQGRRLEQKYKKPGQRIENDLQTNGTLLNDDWGTFLRKNRFPGWLEHRRPEGAARRLSRHAMTASPPSTKCSPPRKCCTAMGCRSIRSRHQSDECEEAAGCVSLLEERSSAAADAVHSCASSRKFFARSLRRCGIRPRLPVYDSPRRIPALRIPS